MSLSHTQMQTDEKEAEREQILGNEAQRRKEICKNGQARKERQKYLRKDKGNLCPPHTLSISFLCSSERRQCCSVQRLARYREHSKINNHYLKIRVKYWLKNSKSHRARTGVNKFGICLYLLNAATCKSRP